MKLKPIEYDDYKTDYEDTAVCPYCSAENEIEPNDYPGQDEWGQCECGGCEKIFAYQIDYRITFTSKPYENWALNELKYDQELLRRLEDLEDNARAGSYQLHIDEIKRRISSYYAVAEHNDKL